MKSSRAVPMTARSSSSEKTPVQVFCRVRPMQSERDLTCIEIRSSNVVVLKLPPVVAGYRVNVNKETHYVFKHIFPESSSQRDVYTAVGEPLIEDLIRGKDGLLFTYGVTGSGKTFTMTGDNKNRGIMQRCLDALFKTISGYQSKKFVFKPDRLNGFEIQSEADAMLERQAEMNSRFNKPRRQDSDSDIASQASNNTKILDGVNEDNMFSVFITYVEVYNNNVYDLLEEGSIQRTLQSKIIREDSAHNMYVHGVTEIEIKSFEEAIEVFRTGQKRKRMGHTILNAESSRSHSVFTIRLVQAPTDMNGDNVIQDRNMINISQLSLVDLAGSERTNRTKNSGQRLREAGNINNSLMTLRTCLEYLRENQMMGVKKKIPYRDSKITHLFKKYFEGEGQVNMIVCVNPRAEDYDETACVLKFAEISQEVQTAKGTPAKFDTGLTPGRRKANKVFRLAENDLDIPRIRKIDFNAGLIYSLGSKFPEYNLNALDNDNLYLELMQHLRHRIDKRVILQKDFNARCEDFRIRLLQVEKENVRLKTEVSSANAILNQERSQLAVIKNKAIVYENSLDELNRKMQEREEQIKGLQRQLNQKQCLLNQREMDRERQKKKFTTKIAMETDKMSRKFENKLREQESKQMEVMRFKDEKLRMVSNILNANNVDNFPQMGRATSVENLLSEKTTSRIANTGQLTYTPRTHRERGVPVANSRHRRSRSAGDKWLEHRAKNPVPVDTILQPYLKNRKSVTKLTDVNDIANSKTSKYCLISQEADTDGELETKLYKGNVIPTCGGGAQVIFNDVECLKQISPTTSPNRKRTNNVAIDLPVQDVASKCTVSIEGHSSKRPKV